MSDEQISSVSQQWDTENGESVLRTRPMSSTGRILARVNVHVDAEDQSLGEAYGDNAKKAIEDEAEQLARSVVNQRGDS
jgi:dsRNA-specific ribonuclease